MHDTSALWKQIISETDHQKEIRVTINGVEHDENRILNASFTEKLFNAPSVGNAISRTLDLTVMPYSVPRGRIPPMSEIRLFVRLVSADRQRVSEFIPKGVFYSDEVRRDTDTGAVTISAFDAIMKMERAMGNAVVRIVFDDGFGGIQRYVREIGEAMPTPDTPAHEGERFVEWYPDPADTPTLERDMLFVAQWVQKFTVIFDDGTETPQTFSCFKGDTTPTPTAPTKDGYTFTGWTPTPAATVTADATYTAQWEQVTLQSVAITAYPVRTTYIIRETLDYTGLIVTAFMTDGSERDVTADCTITPSDGTEITELGNIMVDIHHNGKSVDTFLMTVDATIQFLVITSYPKKMSYTPEKFERLDYSGLSVIAIYNDGSERDVTSECTLSVAEGTWSQDLRDYQLPIKVQYGGGTAYIDISRGPRLFSGDFWAVYQEYPRIEGRNYILFIYGSTPNYSFNPYNDSSSTPWFRYRRDVSVIVIGGNVSSIGAYAFYKLYATGGLQISNGITSIGDYAFASNTFGRVVIPGSVRSMGIGTFSNSVSGSAIILEGVPYIGENAFCDCRMQYISIPKSVKNIKARAFVGCDSLTDVYYRGTEAQWNEIDIAESNGALTSATIHYNSTGPT